MKKEFTTRRKVSAIVALALAGMVTFTAALNTYGDTSNEAELALVFDEEAILERAIEDVTYEEFAIEEQSMQTIKIYDAEDNLVETIELGLNEVVEDAATQALLNRAEFLSEYNSTSIYKISE